MENFRYLLVAIAGLTLIMSVVSGVNPNYFAGLSAYADHADEEEKDDDSSGSNEEHEEDDDDKGKNHEDDEEKIVKSLGNSSKVVLETDEDTELQVEIEDGDLDNGTYDVMFACDSPDVNEEFVNALNVTNGAGEFEEDLSLANGTYTGCEVKVGDLSATFPTFSVMPDDEDEEKDDDDKDEQEDDDEREHDERENEHKERSKLKVEDEGVEIEFKVEGLNMTDGSYDAVFACENPDFNVTLDDAFKVEAGEGELEAEIGLANNTYSGCELTLRGTDTVLASFDSFTVEEEDDGDDAEDKRKERKERIVSTTSGAKIHERHRGENAASPGEYRPSWNYTLEANGTAMHEVDDENVMLEANAAIDVDMSVWKSNRAIILLDIVGGTVEIEGQDYAVRIGYAIYSIQHDAMKLVALATDDDGNVFRLKLRASAVDESDQFPMESGSIDLVFGGSTGDSNNRFEEWNLLLEGTVEAS